MHFLSTILIANLKATKHMEAIKMKQHVKKKKSPLEKGKTVFLIVFLTIPVINFLVFWLYVNFESFLNAFRIEVYGDVVFSFDNWVYFWEEISGKNPFSTTPMLFRNTLKFFSLNLFAILPLSFFFSYFLYKKIRFYKYYRLIFFLPNIISAAVLATLYKFILNPSLGGIVPTIVELFGGEPINYLIDERYAMNAVLVYCLWTGFSVNMIIFNGAMGRVPYEVMEAAQIDGVGFWSEIGRIIIPMTWPTLSTIIVTTVANIFVSSGPILLLTQGDCDTSTIAYWIYLTTKNQLSIYYPSTVAFACTVVSVPLVLLVKKLVGLLWTDVSY